MMQDPPIGHDPRSVVEGLEGASCGPHAKILAIEGIELAERGGTAEEWRRGVAVRHADHPDWEALLREAERCMRAAGLWPWTNEGKSRHPGSWPETPNDRLA